jgi:hypothetical protein
LSEKFAQKNFCVRIWTRVIVKGVATNPSRRPRDSFAPSRGNAGRDAIVARAGAARVKESRLKSPRIKFAVAPAAPLARAQAPSPRRTRAGRRRALIVSNDEARDAIVVVAGVAPS